MRQNTTSKIWFSRQCYVLQFCCNNNNTGDLYHAPCLVVKAQFQKHRGKPRFSFTISVLGSFTCITQHTGPTALRPIQRAKQLWLSVLLKDTSAATGQDSNPHSDNTRTLVQCTRTLGHDTPRLYKTNHV